MTNCPHCETKVDQHEAGRCLDAWVAERVMEHDTFSEEVYGELLWYEGDRSKNYVLPLYSTEIAAAWEVRARLSDMWHPDYLFHLSGPFDIDSWRVQREDPFGSKPFATGATAEIAICRAALKSV